MPQRDYILRLIEQVGLMLKALRAAILGRTAELAEVRRQLRTVLQQVGFDLDVALIADTDTLVRMIAPTGELEPGRGWLVAETMYLDGLEAALDGRKDDAHLSLGKALRLFRMFDASTPIPGGFPAAPDRIAEIEQRLATLNGAGA